MLALVVIVAVEEIIDILITYTLNTHLKLKTPSKSLGFS